MTVSISGAGLITSVGSTPEEVFANLCAGVSGLKPLGGFDREKFHVRWAYEIEDREAPGRDRPLRSSHWLIQVIRDAVRQAGIDPGRQRTAALVGTGLGEQRSLELWHAEKQTVAARSLHFKDAVREALGVEVPVYTLINACAASNFGLGLAKDLLELGVAEAVVVAGCDAITEGMFGVLDRVSVEKPDRVRPFDRNRAGVIMGEGAAAVVVEETERLTRRGASPLAVLRGVGMSCDGYHETAPDKEGIQRAVQDAHERAGTRAEDVDLVLVHGTGTHLNDTAEAQALSVVFAGRGRKVQASAIKSMIGHTSGASGLVGVVVAIQAIKSGLVPPTLGLDDPIEEAACLDFATTAAREAKIRTVQVNAFGFGGVNAVAILEAA